ncbi:hypothetical protein GCM10011297_15380 [Bacterioplanes sanyensis]|uniref:YfaZ family outer membrane protein n=1 Tax=Bacterioplanes sanyensis TaxID=1249553 RepID=UPI001673AFF2|nr:YfaZ family outer membrane protein [Bacterioplanes sanyensis]GGY43483.1 hypothetical protein GCM10011297_15380 [Bacterioplanes sanyensis]
MTLRSILPARSSRLAALLLLLSPLAAQAGGSLDLSLSDHTARLAYDATQMGSGLHIGAAFQHDADDGNMLTLGLHAVDARQNSSNLYIGLGMNAYLYDGHDDDGAALGVGGFFRYRFPAQPDVSVAAYGYYAPPVVSFSETENMIDSDVRLQYAIIPTARAYVGYRYTGIRIEDVDDRLELGEGFHFGFKFDF